MVIGGKWVMTEDEIKKQEMEILYVSVPISPLDLLEE